MKWSNKYLDDGKLRISYGLTGNDRIGPYESIQRYVFGSNYYNGVSGVAPNTTFGNRRLSWESTNQFNTGIDLNFFKGRISISVDYYDKITSGLLYSAPLSSNTGFNTIKVNIGSIQNKGLEFGSKCSTVSQVVRGIFVGEDYTPCLAGPAVPGSPTPVGRPRALCSRTQTRHVAGGPIVALHS